MTNQPPPELFSSERPVHSEFTVVPRKYLIRRALTCCVLAVLIAGAGFGIYAYTRGPYEVPTIKAEGPMKQKPEQPGGIDIPNQDVLAYQQIDNTAGKTPEVEHLLPPPETPQVPGATPAAPPTPPSGHSVESLMVPTPTPPILTTVTQKPKAATDEAPTPDAAPRSVVTATDANAPAQPATAQPTDQPKDHAKGASATFASLPAASAMHAAEPSAPAKDEEKSAPQKAGKSGFRIQLASFPDIDTARHQMAHMEKKFSSQLGDAKIHIAKADLGRRGIYYRLQSNPITDTEARDICKAITKLKGGCIVVKP